MQNPVYFNDFKTNMRSFLVTSRFNNATYSENKTYIKNHKKLACIYCCPLVMTNQIPIDSAVFVLEMNNDKNKIMGIGMVRNHPVLNKYRVYKNNNYNRYVYTGKHYINREAMNPQEELIMKALDILCFKGNTHMKRGQGLQLFPLKILYKCLKVVNILKFIQNMFKIRYQNQEKQKPLQIL